MTSSRLSAGEETIGTTPSPTPSSAALKKERIKKHIYEDGALASADAAAYIDTFYNRTRRHSHLGGQPGAIRSRAEAEATESPRRPWELYSAPRERLAFRETYLRAWRLRLGLRQSESTVVVGIAFQ
jgi:hypothetical protein